MDMDSQFQKAEQDNNDKLSRLKTSVTNQMDDVNSEIKDEADKIYQALDANHNDVTRMAEGAARKSMTDIQGVKAALGKVNDGISGTLGCTEGVHVIVYCISSLLFLNQELRIKDRG